MNQDACKDNQGDRKGESSSWINRTSAGSGYPIFDPFGLPTEAADLGGEAEFSLDGDDKYRSVDILPMPSLSRMELRRPEPRSAAFSVGLGSLNKPVLTSSVGPAKTPLMTSTPPEKMIAPKAPAPPQTQLEAPLLPLDISIFPLEKCHFFTEKKPQVSLRPIYKKG